MDLKDRIRKEMITTGEEIEIRRMIDEIMNDLKYGDLKQEYSCMTEKELRTVVETKIREYHGG